ncbi:ATP-binding protein [Caulobacter sp. NIBR1757]|uniref:ATP-binding protein n=1 Tax=Caulobacter sp. NIBR1757 TaxID=3016000 RepID=UPI0022F03DC1|nr:ATP-binding protein [Caulobacter sp. NIBR1757]WGM39663.1 Adaptive-response sensory-kinase SasA [Caulobacter sp. NIBR1757]
MSSRVRSAPLFVQVMALALVSLVAAPAISAAMLLALPPPQPEVYRLSELAQALRQQGVVEITDGRPLVVKLKTEAPEESFRRSRWREDFKRILASDLKVPVERIRIETVGPVRVLLRTEHRVETRIFRIGPPHGEPPPGGGRHGGPAPGPGAPEFRPDERVIFSPFKVGVQQPDGHWLVVKPKPTFRWDAWQTRLILTFGLSILLIAPLAWLLARRLSAPLGAFAGAADRLGRDPRAAPLEMRGSTEIVAAAAAFNQMQERLRRYVDDRTAMVGAIAHDLRTPLTRLKFRIEAVPEDLKPKLAADIDQMEAMIAATLGFVSDATRPRARARMELASLVESIVDEMAETGAAASIDRTEKLVVEGDPIALRRLVSNLVENALKYGGAARARVYADGADAVIEVDDDGPGIPEHERERVFEPFFRGEPSRNRETGGIGLGLAVVRSVARAHGGDADLINRPGGGLTARVRLPI